MNTFTNPDWFPAKGKSCLLKYGQVSLYLWENVASNCHRNLSSTIPDDYDFNNTEISQLHRLKMQKGSWPSDGRGCEHCRDQEAIGGVSDRMQWLKDDSNKRYMPKELLQNPKTLKVQPTQVSVHFNNKCNAKCVYCGPNLSSAWVLEKRLAGEDVSKFDTFEKKYQERVEKFWKWMDNNYQNLKAFDILGGEPFIQQETWDCVDKMIEMPNPECDVEIYSNMQVKPKLFARGMDKLRILAKTVRRIDFVASIDCWGPASDYIRFGTDTKTFETNMTYLVEECPEIIPTMNWTVSSLSIPYTSDLIKRVIEWNKTRYVSVNYNKCIDPQIYDPHIFPEGTFTDYIEEIKKLNNTMYQGGNKGYLEFVDTMFEEVDKSPAKPELMRRLRERLTELDERRGTDWRETFPWLTYVGHNL
tara:strand:+ start:17743 stop:18990 length:1248 start_codon:yes stop_codon:yes gene_type:complete